MSSQGEVVTQRDLERLRQLVKDGALVHPLDKSRGSFVDLVNAVSLCCGAEETANGLGGSAKCFFDDIGGTAKRHIVLVLCDGMGTAALEEHLPEGSFLREHNQPDRLTAVFPSTTPAALTSLATGVFPGQHGFPGWDLRDQAECDFPGGEVGPGVVHLRVLHPHVEDMRSGGAPVAEKGFPPSWKNAPEGGDPLFVAQPWTRRMAIQRRLHFVNAYNQTDFSDWTQGEFADPEKDCLTVIPETAYETLGTPEGSAKALEYFAEGVAAALERIRAAEAAGEKTYTYLYTAHPDKHMHSLGVSHPEVRAVIRGLNEQIQKFSDELRATLDATVVVTADHGHVTVPPRCMVSLPPALLDCLEYANIGVVGPGRHAVFHCRPGLEGEFERLWGESAQLSEKFLLLKTDDAAREGLFGPEGRVHLKVRPRLGHFLALSVDQSTLVKPSEAALRDGPEPACKGAHGSLTPVEMRIPFVLLK
uniref:Uncharacterized protein n=1 Tax=Chromera velia CCMP2878 TaxID=1169474 RepID=A0A0G4G0G0_9ALVE|eukprot:Cvel_19629.t1-p1 / transcript=Cvel_19629.t1 / gene=Cvel_19629 / organism=Chromera_velia_CCMP2878 / gene_product=hypothetical protein / transcript_product=hypothetical protein / location=Cvel_scaffold1708:31049-33940(+) / protein_length=475 / sequence_SO=supercontig / SO=protein_coding / is_pseudo=false